MKISELAEKLDYDIVGNSEFNITGITYPDEAQSNQIAVAKNRNEVNRTQANVVLTNPRLLKTEKTMLITWDDIDCAMVKVCAALIENGELPDYSAPIQYKKNDSGIYIGHDVSIDISSYVAPNVMIGDNVVIGKNCIIQTNVIIGSGTVIFDGVHIDSGTKVGADSFYHLYDKKMTHFVGVGQTVISEGVHIGCNSIVQRGTISNTFIGENSMIGNCVDIGHDVKIGENCKIVSQSGIAGNVVIKNNVIIYGQAGIANDVTIGNNVTVKAKTLVSKSIENNQVVCGLYGRNNYDEIKLQAKIRRFFNRKD